MNIDHYLSQFIENPNPWQEYQSAPILENIKNDYVKLHFNIEKWHQCSTAQYKQLKLFMDIHVYKTIF